jgi:hypothetical protein
VASQATVDFWSLALHHTCSASVTCHLRVLIVLIVCSYLLPDGHSDTVYVIVCCGHTHYRLDHHQFQLACIAVLLIYLFMRTSSNRFGRFALRCVNKTNIRCWPTARPSSNSHVCRMPCNTCTQSMVLELTPFALPIYRGSCPLWIIFNAYLSILITFVRFKDFVRMWQIHEIWGCHINQY